MKVNRKLYCLWPRLVNKKAEGIKRWREKNKDRVAEMARARNQKNKAKRAEYSAQRKLDPIVKAKRAALYLAKKQDGTLAREREQKRDIIRLRSTTRSAFRRKGWRKSGPTESLLGCPFDVARAWIEMHWLPGMGWHNMPEWDLDHAVPLSTASTPDELRTLCHYTNLRPMWRVDNRRRQDRTDDLSCMWPRQPQPVAAGS